MIKLQTKDSYLVKNITNLVDVTVVGNDYIPKSDDVLCFDFKKLCRRDIREIEEKYKDNKRIYIIDPTISFYFFSFLKPTTASYILVNELDQQFMACYSATECSGVYISVFFKNILILKQNQGNLTDRELDVLILLTEGYSYKEIARITSLTYGTIKNYVSNILELTETDNKTQLALHFQRILKEPDEI